MQLCLTFAARDIRIKYVQTLFGTGWVIVQPTLAYLLISFFFGKLLEVGDELVDYPLFAYCGMMSWYFFTYIAGFSGLSLAQNQDIVQKTNIPKLTLPFSKSLSGLFEFTVWFITLIVIMFIKGMHPGLKVILLPLFVILNMIAGLSIGIWISALSARFRDLFHLIPYIVGASIFVTPVLYPVSLVPQNLTTFIYFNPIAGIIESYRWLILGYGSPSLMFLYGYGLLALVFLSGIFYFRRVEKQMADII